MALFATNPVLFRIKYINRDIIETTRGSNTVLGEAVHEGLKVFLGGSDEHVFTAKDTEADMLKVALDATLEYLNKYPDGFIDWKKNVPNRESLQEQALQAIPCYIKEWDRSHIKNMLMVEDKLEESVVVQVEGRELELPVPMVGYTDYVYEDEKDRVRIVDHKTVFRYTDPDSVDGSKLLQAAIYYLLISARTGRVPYDMTFREYKVSKNEDGSSHTREYQIVYGETPMLFDFFFRLYGDITDALLGTQVYVPNFRAMFDSDVGLLAYIYRLDVPDVLEKEKKRNKVEDIAELMQKKMAKTRNLKRFMEAKATLFTSHVTLNYATMQPHEKIKYKLMEHGMVVNFSDKIEGLAVDLYRFEPSVGIKMTTIEKYRKDVEQVLATSGVRVLAPIPGTNLIGFEVPKAKRRFINLSEAKKAPSLEVAFGVDIYGKRKDVDFREMPHLLVAGTTGSGKSNFLHSFLGQLARLPKHEVRFALCDPKMVELIDFEADPHTDRYADTQPEIENTLLFYVEEMNRRYALFKKERVKSLEAYRARGKKDLPYIIIVIDEFADLILGKVNANIHDCMITLAQKARAAGIHLVIATQRPSTKVVDGLIKANFPMRVAFRTVSMTDSEIIIDRAGAELLLGKGDMLLQGADGITRLQGYNAD